jgi:hypothetical protein
MDSEIAQNFEALERYTNSLLARDSSPRYSKNECTILALQCLNRINQKIGRMARSEKDGSDSMRLLQARVNSVTVAVKNENAPMLRASMESLKNLIRQDTRSA